MAQDMLKEMFKQFENMISSLMAGSQVPGLSVAIAKGKDIIYARGFGARDLETNIPATPDTIYAFGSCSKSYTALAIMQLVEKGKIKLEDPVSKYLPLFKGTPFESSITIHHLLNQTSSIPMLGYANVLTPQYENRKKKSWVPMSSWEDLYAFLNEATTEFPNKPGEKFYYANENFALLSQIVEKVSQMPFEVYMKDKIFMPLKMTRSMYKEEDLKQFQDVFTPYAIRKVDGTPMVTKTVHPFDLLINGAGGLLSTVKDQINYLTAMMHGGEFQGKKILNPDLLEKMHQNYINNYMVQENVGGFEQEGYGYGWMIMNYFGHKLVMHGGQINGATSFIALIPDAKIAIAVACNSSEGQMPTAMVALIALASLLGKNPMKEFKFFEYEAKLEMLTGKYSSFKGIHKITITSFTSQLYFEREDPFDLPTRTIPLYPESEDLSTLKFNYISGPMAKGHAEFRILSENKVDLILDDMVLHRQKDVE